MAEAKLNVSDRKVEQKAKWAFIRGAVLGGHVSTGKAKTPHSGQ